ncbi:hypothetical protein GCM10027425_12510 [Alteromonas gracilis]
MTTTHDRIGVAAAQRRLLESIAEAARSKPTDLLQLVTEVRIVASELALTGRPELGSVLMNFVTVASEAGVEQIAAKRKESTNG